MHSIGFLVDFYFNGRKFYFGNWNENFVRHFSLVIFCHFWDVDCPTTYHRNILVYFMTIELEYFLLSSEKTPT